MTAHDDSTNHSRKHRWTGAPWLLAAAALSFLAASVVTLAWTSIGNADGRKTLELEYTGEMRNEINQPISGVFPLEFKLYKNEGDDKPIWTEQHWVAVASGQYNVRLGSLNRIRTSVAKPGQQLFLGIHLKDVGEIVRDPVTLPKAQDEPPKDEKKADDDDTAADSDDKDPKTPTTTPNTDDTKTAPNGKTTYRTESSFAEVAEFARRAGTAEDSEKLGGKTIEDLEAQIEKLQTQLAELRVQARSNGPAVGSKLKVLPRAGGSGGASFERQCPPGYVVTGIRGTAGALLDSIQPVCSPLNP